ncbi:hypothetical protein NQ317_014815 [Molorchus minor]|uniref:Gag protein n=1 Tax=Molorchus minor TaxID=1323400 RepID=A0ABQ9IVY9_9CUCU|nr:hypothetical protein NQ317_014815 [Molorchus minor]
MMRRTGEAFEKTYFEIVAQARIICNKYDERAEVKSSRGSENSQGSNSNPSASQVENHQSQSLIKLPTIKLPVFEGAYHDWLEFRDIFKALVDENGSLSTIQKFYYLRTSLGKEPSQVIKSLDVSAKNYEHAWKLLRERYENKSLMIHNHIKSIFECPNIPRESHTELRQLFDNVTKHMRSLESLGESTKTWDRLIIYVLTNKFDGITRRDWEQFKYEGELPTMKDMNKFLTERCEMLEKLEYNKKEKMYENQKNKKGFK